jgi:hypothetical protein
MRSHVNSGPGTAPHGLSRWAQDLLEGLPPILSRDEAAHVARVSKKTLDRRIRERRLEAIHADGRVLIPRLALVEFLVSTSGR